MSEAIIMADTTKRFSELDANQTIRRAYNDVDASVTSADFLVGLVGRRKAYVISTTNVANDTVTITYSESGTTLYVIRKIYTSGARTDLLSEERTA